MKYLNKIFIAIVEYSLIDPKIKPGSAFPTYLHWGSQISSAPASSIVGILLFISKTISTGSEERSCLNISAIPETFPNFPLKACDTVLMSNSNSQSILFLKP